MTSLKSSKNIISSNVTLFRNIKKYNFPITLKEIEGRKLTEELIEIINRKFVVLAVVYDKYYNKYYVQSKSKKRCQGKELKQLIVQKADECLATSKYKWECPDDKQKDAYLIDVDQVH